jgi:tellurite resistance protein TehA-like permease
MAMQQIMGNLAQNDPETAALLSASFQDPVFIKEIASKGLAALKTVIVVALCFQALFYFLYYRKAIVAYYYIYLVAFGGVLADLLLIFTSSNTLPLYYYFFIQVLLYFVVILGLFHYGDQYKKERWAAKMAKYNTPA